MTDYDYYGVSLNPGIADGAQSNAPDYLRFLEMLRAGGVYGGTRILSAASVEELVRDQMSQLPVTYTPHPGGVPCGLGAWIERRDARGRTTLASMPGAFGFFGWLDREHDATGVFLTTTFYMFAFPYVGRCWTATDLALAPVGVECSGAASPTCAGPVGLNATHWALDGQPDFGIRVHAAPAFGFGGVSLAFGPPTSGTPMWDLVSYLPLPAPLFAPLPTDASGQGTLTVPLPPGIAGVTVAMQGAWLDPGGCGSISVLASRALRVDIQPP
jgi:hypothetical protein